MFLTYALLVALSLFAIAALPRAVARFLSLEARSLGWTLRHSPPRPRDPLQRVPTAKRAADWNRSTYEKQLATSGSDQARDWTARYAIQAPRVAPRHIPSLRTLLFPLSRQFCKTICGYTVGQIFILASYAALIGFGILFHSNPVTNPKRAGWIAVSQYPVAVLLANKNSVLGFLVGKGYEKLNYLHRWAGKLMCISALFHVVSYRKLTAGGRFSRDCCSHVCSRPVDEKRQSYRSCDETYRNNWDRSCRRVYFPSYQLTSRCAEPNVDHILLHSFHWVLCGHDRRTCVKRA